MNWATVVQQIADAASYSEAKKKTAAEIVYEALQGSMTIADLSLATGYSSHTIRRALGELGNVVEQKGTRRKASATNGRVSPLFRRKRE